MSDLEFFNPGEGGESYDPAAFERFKEKIKKNAAFMATARQQEQRQKQKEDKLAKILLKFIQNNQKSGILMLAARLLEENIPASFILSIILLGNEDLIADLKQEAGEDMPHLANPKTSSQQEQPEAKPSEYSLSTNFGNASLPLKIKAEIDSWGKNIYETGSSIPFRILETALDREGNLKKVVMDCAANVLDDYLAGSGAPQISYDACFSFCEFFIKGIMNAYKKQIENQKELA